MSTSPKIAIQQPDCVNIPDLSDDQRDQDCYRSVLYGYITPKELADQFEVSERTLHRWHACRTGPPRVLIGRKPLYRVDGVRVWLVARERGHLRGRRNS